ncbi:hypothetical protein BDZ97DRAFT_95945 [Flammula alnicola]|nr:hypothetical protein BDZ97DRAFT_95945 [Flammula alnicola]
MPNSHRQTQTFNRHIPIEVVEVIIDHLHNDKKSLNVCTLVARRWLPTSRYHLISSVRVDQKNYRGLLELLSAPYARLAVSVLELKLVRFNEDDNAWLNYALPTFAKHFSSITSLSLAGIKWRQLNPRSVDCIKTAFRKTTKLLLLDCFFVSFSQIIELISSFEVLEDLKCVVCKCDSQGRAPSPQLKMASRLKTFMFDDGHPMLLAWLADQKPIRLQELFVEGISLPRLHSVNALVVHAGSALKRMRFHFEDDYMQHRGVPNLP